MISEVHNFTVLNFKMLKPNKDRMDAIAINLFKFLLLQLEFRKAAALVAYLYLNHLDSGEDAVRN